MVRVIPGVQVDVLAEIVPPSPYPTGILGLIGTATPPREMSEPRDGKSPAVEPFKPRALMSYRELKQFFGEEIGGTLVREGKKAFSNGVYQVYAVWVPSQATKATATVRGEKKKTRVAFMATREGSAANNLRIKVTKGTKDSFTIEVFDPIQYVAYKHSWENVTMEDLKTKLQEQMPVWLSAEIDVNATDPLAVTDAGNPISFTGGSDGDVSPAAVEKALVELEKEPQIDMIYACDNGNRAIHGKVLEHCNKMSTSSEGGLLGPRIGIGAMPDDIKVESEDNVKQGIQARSDRLILVSPGKFAGSVAGLISQLKYYESPTFKKLVTDEKFEDRYTPSQIGMLIRGGVLAVDLHRERGVIVVKGMSTEISNMNLAQISVRRIADQAIRGVNTICESFIGTLNNAQQRDALKQRLVGYFLQMEKDGSIVPSADGEKAAFQVDVYSSNEDFAQGIVRVDVAMRPVRAIDYIYARIKALAY